MLQLVTIRTEPFQILSGIIFVVAIFMMDFENLRMLFISTPCANFRDGCHGFLVTSWFATRSFVRALPRTILGDIAKSKSNFKCFSTNFTQNNCCVVGHLPASMTSSGTKIVTSFRNFTRSSFNLLATFCAQFRNPDSLRSISSRSISVFCSAGIGTKPRLLIGRPPLERSATFFTNCIRSNSPFWTWSMFSIQEFVTAWLGAVKLIWPSFEKWGVAECTS